jgi:hypothetical protein
LGTCAGDDALFSVHDNLLTIELCSLDFEFFFAPPIESRALC